MKRRFKLSKPGALSEGKLTIMGASGNKHVRYPDIEK